MNTRQAIRVVLPGVLLAGIVTFLFVLTGVISLLEGGGLFAVVAVVIALGVQYGPASRRTRDASPDHRWQAVTRGWVAFGSGWWLAGLVLGSQHLFDLLTRPPAGRPSVLEAIGVGAVMGGLLPGAAPFWLAADILGARGLPIGVTGFLIGFIVTVAVWVTLPMALADELLDRFDQRDRRRLRLLSVVPYAAAGAGLALLYQVFLARGRPPLRAAGLALGGTLIAYSIGAGILLSLGIVFLAL